MAGGSNQKALATVGHEDLYAALEKVGWWWDAKGGKWQKDDGSARAKGRFSGSIFEDGEGLPTGVFRLRVMMSPGEGTEIMTEVSEALTGRGISVLEVSDVYRNHKGPGVRMYMTCKRK